MPIVIWAAGEEGSTKSQKVDYRLELVQAKQASGLLFSLKSIGVLAQVSAAS